MYLICSFLYTLYKQLNLNSFVDVLNPYMVYLCFELFFVHNAIDPRTYRHLRGRCNNYQAYINIDQKVFSSWVWK
jgi:hypothetical protein